MAVDFQALWNAYPTLNRPEFFQSLGGGWPKLIDEPNYQNTCALRFSVAMIALGQTPPQDLTMKDGGLKTGAGVPLIVRVTTAQTWLGRLLGEPAWGQSKAKGASIDGLIPPWRGVLLYSVPNASDASGHVDLWDKSGCRMDRRWSHYGACNVDQLEQQRVSLKANCSSFAL